MALLERDQTKPCVGHAHTHGLMFYYKRVKQCTSEKLRKKLEEATVKRIHICKSAAAPGECKCQEDCVLHTRSTALVDFVEDDDGDGGDWRSSRAAGLASAGT